MRYINNVAMTISILVSGAIYPFSSYAVGIGGKTVVNQENAVVSEQANKATTLENKITAVEKLDTSKNETTITVDKVENINSFEDKTDIDEDNSATVENSEEVVTGEEKPVTTAEEDNIAARHEKAVTLAREDKHEEALAQLEDILESDPDNYPVKRDYIIIKTWADQCDKALRLFDATIKTRPDVEPYLTAAIADCHGRNEHYTKGIDLIKVALKKHPKDEDLTGTLNSLQTEYDSATAPMIEMSLRDNKSDGDSSAISNKETQFDLRYSHQLNDEIRGFLKYHNDHTQDPGAPPQSNQLDYNRIGVGLTYRYSYKFTFEYEHTFTTISPPGIDEDDGDTATLIYKPNKLWETSLLYSTFADDTPLRARQFGISAERISLSSNYHTQDYRWTWTGSASQYDFTDNNVRNSYYTAASYAFELKHEREQRIHLELSGSKNKTDTTPIASYYNPIKDRGVSIVYQLDIVYDSKFSRHVDHFYAYVGQYKQNGISQDTLEPFVALTNGGIRAIQEYDINKFSSLSYGAEINSNVYDGNRETQYSLFMSLSHKLN